MSENGKTLYKKIKTTKLGEGLSLSPILNKQAITRTVQAIAYFYDFALTDGAEKVYIFATAAVRSAQNKEEFLSAVYDKIGVCVDVVSGEKEALLGLRGALNGKDGGIIDIGGASTEITVSKDGKTIYSYSLNLGVVRLLDLCGQDREKILSTCNEKISEYGQIPCAQYYGIGGTATSLASIYLSLETYDPEKVNGCKLTLPSVSALAEKLLSMSVEERKKLKGLQPERAEVIAGGAVLLLSIMKRYCIEYITVSESDNLEGYLLEKTGEKYE